jgi:iron complex outermembrane receptor protein
MCPTPAILRGAIFVALLAVAPTPLHAAAPPLDLPLEQLLEMDVRTASRKAERLQDVAAAVFVITREDIERSGVTSLPEALRLAPGIEVARLSNTRWAVSARGFNGRFANKLLVLLDGRSIYSPLFSGVLWEMEDTMLEDIDRIEVIRGPGAALWGSNAVNGVINIITRRARETVGTLAVGGGGTEERAFGAIRHGFAVGEGHVRIWAKVYDRDTSQDREGREGNDWGRSQRIGLRGDWSFGPERRLTVSAMAHRSPTGDRWDNADPAAATGATPYDLRQQNEGAHVVARHEWTLADGSEAALQAYVEGTSIDIPGQLTMHRRAVDVDFQHRLRFGDRHDIVWGLGVRQSSDNIDSSGIIRIVPREWTFRLASAFVQDEITMIPERLKANLGVRLEHNSLTGFEPQPTLRFAWTPTPQTTVWGGLSRAVRTPSRTELDAQLDLYVTPAAPPQPPILLRNLSTPARDLQSERVDSIELGWRHQAGADFSIDAALFHSRYDRLRTVRTGSASLEFVPVPHVVQTVVPMSSGRASVDGAELAVDWRATRTWRLQASYSYLRMRTSPDTDDPAEAGALASLEGALARHRVSLRSSFDLDARTRIDGWLRHVSALPGAAGSAARVDAYTTLDLRLAWRAAPAVELSLVGQNLLDAKHVEFEPDYLRSQTLAVRPSVYAKLLWRF